MRAPLPHQHKYTGTQAHTYTHVHTHKGAAPHEVIGRSAMSHVRQSPTLSIHPFTLTLSTIIQRTYIFHQNTTTMTIIIPTWLALWSRVSMLTALVDKAGKV